MKKKLLTILLSIAVILTSTITVFATGTPSGKTLPYSFDFETDPFSQTNGWTTIDADGDGYDWITDTDFGWAQDPGFGVDESHCVMSRSYVNGVGPRNANNWLFSPAITIPVSGATVSWYEQSQDAIWPDSYTVYVSETNTSTDTSKMTEIFSGTAANPWNQRSVELEAAEYAGKTVYIAFRHQSEDCYILEIDDFAVKVVAPAHTHAFTYTANNGKLTATCVDGCDDGYDTNPLTLTLTAPTNLVYDGNAKAFTFADGEADVWTGAGLELPTITYYQKYSGQGWYTQLNEVPVNTGGDYKAEIVVNNKAAQVKFTIDKATPYIKTNPAPNDIDLGDKLSVSTLFGGYAQVSSTNTTQVGGLFEWKFGDTIPELSDSETTEYDVTFTPADTNNFNTVSCKVKIKVNHTHAPVLVNGQAATESAAGWKDYYECACGALFEDENGTTPIENLATWKAEGGNGYIAPLTPAKTIADVLAMSEKTFPTTKNSGWLIDEDTNNYRAYSDGTNLNVANGSVALNSVLTKDGNNYKIASGGPIYIFKIESNILKSIDYSAGFGPGSGEYIPYKYEIEQTSIPKGSTQDLVFKTNGVYTNEGDVEVKLNNQPLTLNTDYKVKHGSIKVTLLGSYIKNLVPGTYTISIGVPDSYDPLTSQFTITGSSPIPTPKPGYVVPKTGVE